MDDVVIDTVTVLAVFADQQRAALTAPLIEGDDELELVGRASGTEELLALAEQHLPDVVLLDLANPAVDAERVVTHLRRELPVVRVLPVADRLDGDTYGLLRAGAAGGLDRSQHAASIASVLVGAARREVLLPRGWAERALQDVAAASTRDPFADVLRLTETEHEVVERLAAGETVAAIADDYGVTQRLVALHVGYAVTKLQRHAGLALVGSATEAPPQEGMSSF